MLCDSTKTLLRTIVQSLEASDKPGWDDLIESSQAFLYEMHQMTRPLYKGNNGIGPDVRFPVNMPDLVGLSRAMPHAKAMVAAIRRRDRTTALENGNAALVEINASRASRLSGSPTDQRN